MAKKYTPIADLATLKAAEQAIDNCTTIDELRDVANTWGPKAGWKAFGYILARRNTPEELKAEGGVENGDDDVKEQVERTLGGPKPYQPKVEEKPEKKDDFDWIFK